MWTVRVEVATTHKQTGTLVLDVYTGTSGSTENIPNVLNDLIGSALTEEFTVTSVSVLPTFES